MPLGACTWLSLVWYSPILLIKSIYAFILSVVYFYSERPSLFKIVYSLCVLYLLQNAAILQRCVAQDFGEISQLSSHDFPRQNIRKQYYGFPQESPCLRTFCFHDNVSKYYYFLILSFLKLFVVLVAQTNWPTCGQWMRNYGLYTTCLWQTACHLLLLIYE